MKVSGHAEGVYCETAVSGRMPVSSSNNSRRNAVLPGGSEANTIAHLLCSNRMNRPFTVSHVGQHSCRSADRFPALSFRISTCRFPDFSLHSRSSSLLPLRPAGAGAPLSIRLAISGSEDRIGRCIGLIMGNCYGMQYTRVNEGQHERRVNIALQIFQMPEVRNQQRGPRAALYGNVLCIS